MNKLFIYAACTAVVLIYADTSFAQTYSTGRESQKTDVNMTEVSNYYKEHPLMILREKPFNEADDDEEEEERARQRRPRSSEIHLLKRAINNNVANAPGAPSFAPSPVLVDTFQSTPTSLTSIPPDTHGAVDSQYCITAINTAIHIQTRGGANVSSVGLNAFWSSILPAGTSTFDPRVHYDPLKRRWMMVTDAVASTMSGTTTTYSKSTVLIAVSATSDPTGIWHMYSVSVDPTNAVWMDFPNMGYNSKWIMITGNLFPGSGGGGAGGDVAYVFNYDSIMNGTGAPFTKISTTSFSLCPAITYDANEPNLYALQISSATAGQLRLWKISGDAATPVMTSVGYPTSPQHFQSGPAGGSNANFAPQVGGTGGVNIGDTRITRVMYRNNKLWCSHTVFLPATGTVTRSSVMWWQMDTLANPIQIGLIDDPTSTNFYAYPSIAVNANDDAIIGCGAFSKNIHPSAAYALHLNGDPLDSTRPPVIFRQGQAYYYETFSSTRNRWGDYSGACVDPKNDTDFWTLQESSLVGTSPNWDTWWANVQFCPKPVSPTLLSSPVPCSGNTGTYKLHPVPGATYVWSVSGTGWIGSGGNADTINVAVGTGTGTIKVTPYNGCGAGETQTFNLTSSTIPPQPSIGTVTPACIGSPVAKFIVTSSGATYYRWQAFGPGWSGTTGATTFSPVVGTDTGIIVLYAANVCGQSMPDTLLSVPAIEPISIFSVANRVINVNVKDVFTFTGSAPAGSSYSWDFGIGSTATPGTGAGPQTVSWNASGIKKIILSINNGGCVSTYTDSVEVDNITLVNEPFNGDKDIRIVPNPSDGSFRIMFNNPVNKAISVVITDMQGRTVYTNDFGVINKSELAITANNLIPGNYAISINIDGAAATQKITITR